MFKNFLKIFFEIITLIKNYKKIHLIVVLIFFTILSSIFEILTIGSLIPLMEVLIDPGAYINNSDYIFKRISILFNENDLRKIILFAFVALIIISYLLKILIIWFSALITYDISLYLNEEVFENTISKKYKYFSDSHTSIFISNQEKTEHVKGMIFSFINLFISLILSTSIILFLFYLNYKIAIIISLSAIISYLLVFIKFKEKLNYISSENVITINNRFKFLIESSENIKEIKLRDLKSFFVKKFYEINLRIKKFKISSTLISNLPSQVILMLGTIFLSVLMFYYSSSDQGLVNNIPFLAALVLAIQKIFPQAQNVYVSLTGIKQFRNSLFDLKKIVNLEKNNIKNKSNEIIELNNFFELKNIFFKHNKTQENLFENANLKFEINNMYGIQGESGLGKTSIVDIITGLLPASGDMYVDGNKIDLYENNSWQKNIAHLPQNSLLTDTTILENIAYGEKYENISSKNVEEAAKKANIYDFIQKTEKGFLTTIGEKGIRISGGQRQRISIAKLFYLNKKIMILDEATNALDVNNEEKIYKSLKESIRNKIIIVICHNLKMNKHFDYIYNLKDKKFILKDKKN